MPAHDMTAFISGRAISREAARKRRRVESEVFADLCRLLPLRASVRDHLDKPSVIRLALCYIRLKALLQGDAPQYSYFNLAIWVFLVFFLLQDCFFEFISNHRMMYTAQ